MPSRLKTNVVEFFTWWHEGIVQCIPRRLREKLIRTPNRIHIRQEGGRVILKLLQGGSGTETAVQEFLMDDAETSRQVARWVSEHADSSTRICLLAEPASLLCKDLALPLASEADLNDILHYELDRQTPFSTDQVYFGYRIRGRDRQGGKLLLRLFVLPRGRAKPLQQLLLGQEIPLHAILAYDENESGAEINLLFPEERSAVNGGPDRNTLTRALICASILLAVLYLPIIRQQDALNGLVEQLDGVRQQVREIQPLLDERDELLQRGHFLQEQRLAHIPAIVLIAELSRILPDDTWLNRLVFQNREIQLYGESAAETELIQILESSSYFHDAHFQSPVTYNNASGKNNFQISVTAQREPGS